MQRWSQANNAPPNGSLYCVLDSNEMTMKSPCREALKKYNGDGRA
jgi:hypothetical protein